MSFSHLLLIDQLSIILLFSYLRIIKNESKVEKPVKKMYNIQGCQHPTKESGYSVCLSAKELLCYNL